LFEQPSRQFERLFFLTQTKGDTGCFCDHLDGASQGSAPKGTWRVGRYVTHSAADLRFVAEQNINPLQGGICLFGGIRGLVGRAAALSSPAPKAGAIMAS
jgi:hypothetical protein